MASPQIPSAADLRASLEKDGFVCIPKVFTGAELTKLQQTARTAVEQARASQWPHIRTLPKQFPPWGSDASLGIWGVQHLLHPQMPGREAFAESYFHPILVDAITGLLRCERQDLVLELYNMLVRPERDFALRWHRDDIGPDVPAEQELERLREPMMHAQWNLALFDDSSLVVVPGSHRRARTEMERGADPFEDDMPGQRIVKMGPGDIMFYNNNILHRGVYDSTQERMTLHGTMGIAGTDHSRARNILQHGIGQWAGQADFDSLADPEMRSLAVGMKARLMEMGGGENLGFSQADV